MLCAVIMCIHMRTIITRAIGFRVSPDLYKLTIKVSKARGQNLSGFLRGALLQELARLGFLPDEQRRALGIITEKGITQGLPQ